ncbi:MAG: tetratricopeptide repeat protein, partial [Vicinamibacterales bacterium]
MDRAAIVRQAEKLLRQGKLEQAIAEYLRLVEDQPRDWNTANQLGDLYVRAGQLDLAAEQFARIAEHLCRDGFLQRASALYKKILKLQPDADRALIRAAELAARQGLLADARAFFATAATGRQRRGDAPGALDIAVRLGALDSADVPARLASARARVELGDTPGALHEYTSLAAWLAEQGRESEAVAPLRAALDLDPGSAAAARELARILVAAGRLDEAAPYLTPENIGSDPILIRFTAQLRVEQGDTAAGLELVDRLLIGDDEAPVVVAEMVESLAASRPESAWELTARLVGASVERADWHGADAALRRFIARVPHHVPALTRLLDVCVDGALDDGVLAAQALLADAYLATGAAGSARYVAEDLVARQPWVRAHYARMRAALAAEGEADPDRALADWLAETPEFGMGAAALFEASDAQVPTDA